MGVDPPFVPWTRFVFCRIRVVRFHLGEARNYILSSSSEPGYQTRLATQVTAIITQLVFEHALRIRVKAETGGEGKDDDPTDTSPKESANLLGKITNLVTIDLSSITDARNIGFLLILVPIQVVGGLIFLYKVLGWRSARFLHMIRSAHHLN
jgi:hypothetical protein